MYIELLIKDACVVTSMSGHYAIFNSRVYLLERTQGGTMIITCVLSSCFRSAGTSRGV